MGNTATRPRELLNDFYAGYAFCGGQSYTFFLVASPLKSLGFLGRAGIAQSAPEHRETVTWRDCGATGGCAPRSGEIRWPFGGFLPRNRAKPQGKRHFAGLWPQLAAACRSPTGCGLLAAPATARRPIGRGSATWRRQAGYCGRSGPLATGARPLSRWRCTTVTVQAGAAAARPRRPGPGAAATRPRRTGGALQPGNY